MSGDTPDNIWPVIMPGMETSPTANSELVMGIRDALKAILRACSYSTFLPISASSLSAARLNYQGNKGFRVEEQLFANNGAQ
jgi:hypothetical protein